MSTSTTIKERQPGSTRVDPVGKTVSSAIRPIGGGWPLGDPPIEYGDREEPVGYRENFNIFSRLQRLIRSGVKPFGEVRSTATPEVTNGDSSSGQIRFNMVKEEINSVAEAVTNQATEIITDIASEIPGAIKDLSMEIFYDAFKQDPEDALNPEEREEKERNIAVVKWNRNLEASQNQAKSQRVRELEKNTVRITESQIGLSEVAQLVGRRVEELGINHPLVIWTKRQEQMQQAEQAKEENKTSQVTRSSLDIFMDKRRFGESQSQNILGAVG